MSSSEFQDSTKAAEKTKAVDPMIGKILDGRYEVLRLLGSGGMGAVYQANQVAVNKPVAVKIMHQQFIQDERSVARFRHEVKAMSTLSHPNLISIIDAGSTDYGSPYFVMEYLPSKSLAEILDEEVFLPPDRVKSIVFQIADALSHAHERGIIHRDLKPPNILIIDGAARDHIKVVDLGVAKMLCGDEAALMKLTQTGEVFGSPLYMAPEQVLGRPHDVRTDVYQLGVVMFEMLTGVPPHVKPSAIMTMNSHVAEDTPTFNQVQPDLPMDDALRHLEKVALKCLEKEPPDRYQTMKHLMLALEDDIKPAPVQERQPPAVAREGKPQSATDRISLAQQELTKAEDANKKRTLLIFIIAGVVMFVMIAAIIIGVGTIFHPNKVTNSAETEPVQTADMPVQNQLYTLEYPAVASDSTDVRVLSVYEGKQDAGQSSKTSERKGTINVDVSHEGKPLTLVLNSYMPTTWTVRKESRKVKIKKVISVGYYQQTVKGVPPHSVQKVYYTDGSKTEKPHDNVFEPFHFLYVGDVDLQSDSEFTKMKSVIEKYTTDHLRNFQGTRSTDHFEVR